MNLFFSCSQIWEAVSQLKTRFLLISLPRVTPLILSLSVSIFPRSCLNHKGHSLITFDSLTCHCRGNMTCKHTRHTPRHTLCAGMSNRPALHDTGLIFTTAHRDRKLHRMRAYNYTWTPLHLHIHTLTRHEHIREHTYCTVPPHIQLRQRMPCLHGLMSVSRYLLWSIIPARLYWGLHTHAHLTL